MARRRRGKSINGWLAVDKPLEITSSTVVNQVRRLLDANDMPEDELRGGAEPATRQGQWSGSTRVQNDWFGW